MTHLTKHPVYLTDEELLKECDLTRGRSSGPGGQHRNKVETAVVITHTPTGVSGQASERRSQIENKRVALKRLRLNLAAQVRSQPSEVPAQPSELWQSRRRGSLIVCSDKHRDFPLLLAEALDAIACADWEPKPAADQLGISTSQLIKFVKNHRRAFENWNSERRTQDKHQLK
jgi:RF-1 domain